MINYTTKDISFPSIDQQIVSDWITKVCLINNRQVGDLNLVFCSDDYILEVNKQFLDHHYYTDIITFNSNIGHVINGDLIISLDTVKSNSIKFSTSYISELHRVIIHGVLHLIGFNDKSSAEQDEMSKKEDESLSLLPTFL